MLQYMRIAAKSWVVKTLMAILIVSFSIWGVGDVFRTNYLKQPVASVGKDKITMQEFTSLFDQNLRNLKQYNPAVTAKEAKQFGLIEETLEREITRRLIDAEVRRLGVSVSEEPVLDIVRNEPAFRKEDGSFDKERFIMLLRQQQVSEKEFVNIWRSDISRRMLMNVVAGAAFVPQYALDAIFKAKAQKRIFDIVNLDSSKIDDIPVPDENTLQEFYDKNTALFLVPEYRDITIATLSLESIAKDIDISEEDLSSYYETSKEQLAKPETRGIIQSVLFSQEQADQLSQRAKLSKDLALTAKSMQEPVIPIDNIDAKTLMPDLAQAVFSMTVGDISEPIKTQLGWHVIQLKSINPAGVPSFEDAKAELLTELRLEKAKDAAIEMVNKLDDALASGQSLEEIAETFSLRLIKIQGIDATGVLSSGSLPSEMPNRNLVLQHAFSQEIDDTSPIESDNEGLYFVVKTDSIKPSGVKPFSEIKNMVASAWKQQQQVEQAKVDAESIEKALKEGAALAGIAKKREISARVSTPLTMLPDASSAADREQDLPDGIMDKAFNLRLGETAFFEQGEKWIIVRLAKVEEGSDKNKDVQKSLIEAEMSRIVGAEILTQYVQYLRSVTPVKIHTNILEQFKQQD